MFYSLGYFLGNFLFMIIFLVIAIVRAKNGNPWIWYAIGVALQFISILGRQQRYSAFGIQNALGTTWALFFVLAVVGAVAIYVRRKS